MTIEKANMDWYRKEHLRIVETVQQDVRDDAGLKALIIRPVDEDPLNRQNDPAVWEEWLKDANREAHLMLRRLRIRANELWVAGSAEDWPRQQFTTAVETEFRIAVWAAREYLRVVRSEASGASGEGQVSRSCRHH